MRLIASSSTASMLDKILLSMCACSLNAQPHDCNSKIRYLFKFYPLNSAELNVGWLEVQRNEDFILLWVIVATLFQSKRRIVISLVSRNFLIIGKFYTLPVCTLRDRSLNRRLK